MNRLKDRTANWGNAFGKAAAIAALAAISVAFAAAQATAQSPQQTAPPKHLAVAEKLLAHLDLAHTNYEHGTPSVSFKAPYESHTDCSGFIDALLAESYGYTKDQMKDWLGSTRPTAKRYHDAIEESKGFTHIEHVQSIQPGDILAVKYFNNKANTGHVMLVASRPQKMSSKEPEVPGAAHLNGTVQWTVAVIDSSESGHGTTDTRHKKGADGKDHDGLGQGVLRIYSDAAGNVAGFAWSTLASSKFKEPSDEHLVIGRLKQ